MKLYLIYQDEYVATSEKAKKSLVAVCDSRKKAIGLITELVAEPCCQAPLEDECFYDEYNECGQIANKFGYSCFYYIREAYMNEYIE